MAKTKISEFSATPGNNTDIDGINIAEGCAPSGINDAIRELMSQLKDFQTGAAGDSFNGPVGTTTAAAGAFTTLSASSTVSGTGFSNYLASPPAIGGTAAAAGSFTTLTTSSTVTHNGGTANGVAYLNGSKVLTTGSALYFDGTNLGVGTTSPTSYVGKVVVNGHQSILGGNGLFLWDSTNANAPSIYAPGDSFAFKNNAGSELMRLTSTGLGIGTSSIDAKLNVAGTVGVGTTSAKIRRNQVSGSTGLVIQGNANDTVSDTNPGAYINIGGGPLTDGYEGNINLVAYGATTDSNRNQIIFSNRSGVNTVTERMRLDSSGNLGLGVTPSAWRTAGGEKAIQVGPTLTAYSNSGGDVYWNKNWYLNSSTQNIYLTNGYAQSYGMVSGEHRWYTAASGTAGAQVTFTQAMTLDASGNLVIGNTTAGTRLDAQVSNPTRGLIARLSNTATSGQTGSQLWFNQAAIANWVIGQPAGEDAFAFWNGRADNADGTRRVTIDSSGNWMVGKTASSATTVGVEERPGGGVFATCADSTSGTTTYHVYSTGAAAYRFYVGLQGQVYCTNTTITALSDERLKENIKDLDVGLDKIMALKPRLYDWKEGKGANVKNARGFIAQEFEQVFPDLIDEWKDPAPEGEEPYKSVRQDLIPVLVKAIQEQQAIIETLTARVAALESK